MKTLSELVPNHEDLLSLQPEEVGGVILQILFSATSSESIMHRNNFLGAQRANQQYSKDVWHNIERILTEGWAWLESEGLIAPDPNQSNGWVFITRRGKLLDNPKKFQHYRSSSALKKELLHPLIAEKAWSAFLRGDYDSAVFIAFKEVEVKVRDLSKQEAEVVGTDLMRKAFGPPNGPLVRSDLPKAEQEALAHLFAGAIGWFKNPQSHRKVGLGHTDYAVQTLLFASHLMYMAEEAHIFT